MTRLDSTLILYQPCNRHVEENLDAKLPFLASKVAIYRDLANSRVVQSLASIIRQYNYFWMTEELFPSGTGSGLPATSSLEFCYPFFKFTGSAKVVVLGVAVALKAAVLVVVFVPWVYPIGGISWHALGSV